MYTNQREAYRQAFYEAWQKYLKQLPLTILENQMVEIILIHPEYHDLLSNNEQLQKQEFKLEENPFFHMSLHMAIREQIRSDRPKGIALIHQQLLQKYVDQADVEHKMITCLAQTLWQAQQTGHPPEEIDYLNKLKFI